MLPIVCWSFVLNLLYSTRFRFITILSLSAVHFLHHFNATSPHKVFIDLWEWAFSVDKLSSLLRVQFRKCCVSRLPKLIHPLKHANPFAMWATYGELCLDFELVTGNWEVRNERLATFESFPLSDFRKLTKLADSGFHYTGYRDRVKCHG